MKLNVMSFALTCGILWAAGLFIITWWLIATKGITYDPTWFGQFYIGYKISPLGSLIGLVYALIDGTVGGAIFALLYNRLLRFFSQTKPE